MTRRTSYRPVKQAAALDWQGKHLHCFATCFDCPTLTCNVFAKGRRSSIGKLCLLFGKTNKAQWAESGGLHIRPASRPGDDEMKYAKRTSFLGYTNPTIVKALVLQTASLQTDPRPYKTVATLLEKRSDGGQASLHQN